MSAPRHAFVFPPATRWPIAVNNVLSPLYLADESQVVQALLAEAQPSGQDAAAIAATARQLVEAVRRNRQQTSGLDAFMTEYDLSSAEGVVLMCLAEALLRIPDSETADRLIADKLASADWEDHLGTSESLLVNASTWGLMLTGRLMRAEALGVDNVMTLLARLAGRLGEPVVRTALRQAMRIMGHQFVMGRTIEEAFTRAHSDGNQDYRYSFDMLGEAALTRADAQRYRDAYHGAISALGKTVRHDTDWMARVSVSIKLSALQPRFEFAQADRAVPELVGDLLELAVSAKSAGIALTVDSEEADRLDLTLAIFERVLRSRELADWPGFGIAIQTYQKRGRACIDRLQALAREVGRTIPVRLVKGAYWDAEIKHAQERGLAGYPVFTRKSSTDVAYLASARALLAASPALYGQFATHNAHTAASILRFAGDTEFEFQRLHGMGEELFAEIVGAERFDKPCRVYAPVGSHEDLLPYLVRRLLENGSNTSFVNRLIDERAPVESIIADPAAATAALGDNIAHPRIPLPRELFGTSRPNSAGINFADPLELTGLADECAATLDREWVTRPLVAGEPRRGAPQPSIAPHDGSRIGTVEFADAAMARAALDAAHRADRWQALSVAERATILRRGAQLYQEHRGELLALIVREAGRTLADAASELREAVDFLNYYAWQSEQLAGQPTELPGPTGEANELRWVPRGVFLCISPWNFPLAIFTGQIAAALAAGNSVLAKPAEQTGLVAGLAVALLHEAGIPADALQLLPGSGPEIGDAVLADPRLAGVAFTGSTATAGLINQRLAQRDGPLATLIAETGGVNAMIVDSSALPEQVVRDTLQSAFNSAGQRCSALRLLCLQEEIADRVLQMLAGAVQELVVGDPALIHTDVGPVIDATARAALLGYLDQHQDRVLFQVAAERLPARGYFVPPTALALASARDLTEEVFGPILHVTRYQAAEIDGLVDDINDSGFGLTLGIHSRVDSLARRIAARARVGNVYINRNMIGAVVGVQPFGGMGLSGTGPKAGGPHYLQRFMTEQTLTTNTAAAGGNATLLTLD